MNEVTSPASANHFFLVDLLREQTRDLYDAEKRHRSHLEALDRRDMLAELAEYFDKLVEDTSDNIQILEEVCRLLDVPPEGVECAAMTGLVREAKDAEREWERSAVRDAALIANEQRIVHYQIAGYGTAKAFSDALHLKEAAKRFDAMLRCAHENDKKLTRIACGGWLTIGVNEMAIVGD